MGFGKFDLSELCHLPTQPKALHFATVRRLSHPKSDSQASISKFTGQGLGFRAVRQFTLPNLDSFGESELIVTDSRTNFDSNYPHQYKVVC